METHFIIQEIKKRIRVNSKKKLTLKSLQKMIGTADNMQLAIMLIALVMGDSETKNKVTWKWLSEVYLQTYRKEILDYYGFVCDEEISVLIRVNNTEKLFSVFSGLKKEGTIGNCSYMLLANRLKKMFDLPYVEQTIVTKLKEAV